MPASVGSVVRRACWVGRRTRSSVAYRARAGAFFGRIGLEQAVEAGPFSRVTDHSGSRRRRAPHRRRGEVPIARHHRRRAPTCPHRPARCARQSVDHRGDRRQAPRAPTDRATVSTLCPQRRRDRTADAGTLRCRSPRPARSTSSGHHDKTRGAGLLATDATRIPILDPEAPDGPRSGTMWGWTNALWVSFFYSPNGDADSVRRFLGESNCARIVQAGRTNLLTFIECAGGKRPGCWSHARRGVVLCARSGNRVALHGLKLIAPLFQVERESRDAGDNAAQRRHGGRRKARRLSNLCVG